MLVGKTSFRDIGKFDPILRRLRIWRGEYHQVAVIKMAVGVGDQLLVPGTIVPAQTPHREQRQCGIQDTVRIAERGGIIVILTIHTSIKETGWRQLLGITHHHQLLAPGDNSQRILWLYLRCFIHHHQVEFHPSRFKVMSCGHWPHHEAGFYSNQSTAGSVDQLPDWNMSGFFSQLIFDQCQFGVFTLLTSRVPLRDMATSNLRSNALTLQRNKLFVVLLERCLQGIALGTGDPHQFRVSLNNLSSQLVMECQSQTQFNLLHRERSGKDCRPDPLQSAFLHLFVATDKVDPPIQPARLLNRLFVPL
ncbi:hypothetical protein D3C76_890520 [compost metagenome]